MARIPTPPFTLARGTPLYLALIWLCSLVSHITLSSCMAFPPWIYEAQRKPKMALGLGGESVARQFSLSRGKSSSRSAFPSSLIPSRRPRWSADLVAGPSRLAGWLACPVVADSVSA